MIVGLIGGAVEGARSLGFGGRTKDLWFLALRHGVN